MDSFRENDDFNEYEKQKHEKSDEKEKAEILKEIEGLQVQLTKEVDEEEIEELEGRIDDLTKDIEALNEK